MKIGTDDFSAGYVGNDEVQKLYLGNDLVWEKGGELPYEQQYLTFEFDSVPAPGEGAFVYTKTYNYNWTGEECPIYYRVNGGSWIEVNDYQDNFVTVTGFSVGDIVEFKGTNPTYCKTGDAGSSHTLLPSSTSTAKCYGNIMSMIGGDNFSGLTEFTSTNKNAFCNFFARRERVYYVETGNLSDVENLILPVTTMYDYARENCYYRYLFSRQTLITKAPLLPAETVPTQTNSSYGAYTGMFSGCTALTYIACLATNIDFSLTNPPTKNWVSQISTGGSFYRAANTTWGRGADGIPGTWIEYVYPPA